MFTPTRQYETQGSHAALRWLLLGLAMAALSAQAAPLALNGVQSRKVHLPSTTFDLPIAATPSMSGAVTVETRARGSGHQVVFQFNAIVTTPGTLTVVDDALATVAASAAAVGTEVIVTLPALADDRRVTVSLSNVDGSGLDVSASLGFLVGDVDGTRAVNATDVTLLKGQSGQAAGAGNFTFDLNASGAITATDILAAKGRLAAALPAGNFVLSLNGGNNQVGAAGAALASPLTAMVASSIGNPVAGVAVSWAATSGGGSVGGATSATNASGIASINATLGATGGANAYTAKVAGLNGSPITFNATAAKNIAVNAGNFQVGVAGTQLATSLSVKVTDNAANAIPGITVSWAATAGGGSVGSPTSTTNGSGIASTNATLGVTGGTNTYTATVSGLTGSPVGFTETAAKTIAVNAGNFQTGVAGTQLATPLAVKVSDNAANGVAGITVSWAATAGGGSVGSPTSTTNGSGIASTNATLGVTGGANTFTATVAGLTGSPAAFSETAAKNIVVSSGNNQSGPVATPLPLPLAVLVTDGGGNPVSGISVSWAATAGGGSVGGPTSLTNASGVASINAQFGPGPGPNTFTATVTGLTGSPVTFTETAL